MLFYVIWKEIPLFALATERLDFSATRIRWRVNLVRYISISEKAFTLNKSWSAVSSYSSSSFSLPLVKQMGLSWQPLGIGLKNSFNETFKLGVIWKEMWYFCSCKTTTTTHIKDKVKLTNSVKFAFLSVYHHISPLAVNHLKISSITLDNTW